MTGSASGERRGQSTPITLERQRPRPEPSARRAFHLLAKPVGPICNLDCTYCFYLSTKDRYPGATFAMQGSVLETYLDELLSSHAGPEIVVAWQGGEPTLLGVDFFRRAVALAEERKRPGTTLLHTIQTNGTLLDDEWASFFSEVGMLVGISIDGPEEVHDVHRLDRRGRGTHARVVEAIELLRRHGVEVNALVTVHAANEHVPLEVYRHLRDDLSLRYLQLIPIVEFDDDGELRATSVSPRGWGSALRAIFDEWLRHDVGEVFVSTFDAALAPLVGLPATTCVVAETCGSALAVEHNGDVFSCDHFVNDEHLLGNLTKTPLLELLASPAQVAFGAAKRDRLPEACRRCPVLDQCHGECPKNRRGPSAGAHAGLNVLCEGYYDFFTATRPVLTLMAEHVFAGGFADEVPARLFDGDPTAPCPCRSGARRGDCHRR